MKRALITSSILLTALAVATPSFAQLGRIRDNLGKAKSAYDDLNFTDAEEHTLGSDISAKLREKYGVVQNPAVHKYVTLVGRVLAQESSRPGLRWTFVVLDTDGVNAFAAPGGFIHITKGALALVDNESELADVLGHEIGHVTEKHTIHAIQKSKVVRSGTDRAGFLKDVGNAMYDSILENNFNRSEENEADRVGITLANTVGYAPQGMSRYLTKLSERNKDLKEPSGPFASHPATQARLQEMTRLITRSKLTATALVAARFNAAITFTPVPVSSIPQVAPPTPSASASSSSSSGGGRTGLSAMNPLGREKSGSQTVSSAGSRGANPDRDARGGPNKRAVTVTVTAAEIAAFRKGIA